MLSKPPKKSTFTVQSTSRRPLSPHSNFDDSPWLWTLPGSRRLSPARSSARRWVPSPATDRADTPHSTRGLPRPDWHTTRNSRCLRQSAAGGHSASVPCGASCASCARRLSLAHLGTPARTTPPASSLAPSTRQLSLSLSLLCQADIDYDALSVSELKEVVSTLKGNLELAMGALSGKMPPPSAPAATPAPVAPPAAPAPAAPAAPAATNASSIGLKMPAACEWSDPDGVLPWSFPVNAEAVTAYLTKTMQERIMMLDGAMGTVIQNYKFDEDAFRGEKWKGIEQEIKGNNDLLCFTQPDTIREIHRAYYAAGSDICETNTFSGTTIAQADYGMESIVYELNKIASELAVAAAAEVCVCVCASLSLSLSLSLSPGFFFSTT